MVSNNYIYIYIFFFFTPIWGRFPIWLIFFRWDGSTTNQLYTIYKSLQIYAQCNRTDLTGRSWWWWSPTQDAPSLVALQQTAPSLRTALQAGLLEASFFKSGESCGRWYHVVIQIININQMFGLKYEFWFADELIVVRWCFWKKHPRMC